MLVRKSQYKDGREVELSVFVIDLLILICVIDIRKVISGIWHLLVSVGFVYVVIVKYFSYHD